jgi:hypothetical protein
MKDFVKMISEYTLFSVITSSEEIRKITTADLSWLKKRKHRFPKFIKFRRGDVYIFEFEKAIIPEIAYVHMGIVIRKSHQYLYVYPITSKKSSNTVYNNAYHPIDNPNGDKKYYLIKQIDFPHMLQHDSIIKICDLKTISTKRQINYICNPLDTSIGEEIMNDIEDFVIVNMLPRKSHQFNQMKNELQVHLKLKFIQNPLFVHKGEMIDVEKLCEYDYGDIKPIIIDTKKIGKSDYEIVLYDDFKNTVTKTLTLIVTNHSKNHSFIGVNAVMELYQEQMHRKLFLNEGYLRKTITSCYGWLLFL